MFQGGRGRAVLKKNYAGYEYTTQYLVVELRSIVFGVDTGRKYNDSFGIHSKISCNKMFVQLDKENTPSLIQTELPIVRLWVRRALSALDSWLLSCSQQTECLQHFGGIVSRVCEDVRRSRSSVIDV